MGRTAQGSRQGEERDKSLKATHVTYHVMLKPYGIFSFGVRENLYEERVQNSASLDPSSMMCRTEVSFMQTTSYAITSSLKCVHFFPDTLYIRTELE
jgi:hypothetical protein